MKYFWMLIFACSISCAKEMNLGIQTDQMNLKANVYYDKENIQIFVYSSFGKEIQAGQDKNEFWFWSKRYKSGKLFVCKNEDYHLSNLKTVYNPVIIKEFLGLIKYDFSKFSKINKDGKIYYFKEEKDSTGRDVGKFIVYSNKVDGIYIYHRNKLVVSCENMKYTNGSPSEIKIKWTEESKEMQIEVIALKDNNENKFKKPNLPKINMADY